MFFSVQYVYVSHRSPNAIRSGGERNPIGRRTESNRVAYGIRSGGGRNPIRRRTRSGGKTKETTAPNKVLWFP